MNASKEQSQKVIGFRLYGNMSVSLETSELAVDLNKTFEIPLIPGTQPVGTLTQLGKQDDKTVVVELPEEIKQGTFEKLCTFLLEKNAYLVVKESGYEKLNNRKLHLELCHDLKQPLVNMVLLIQGKSNSFDYEIALNPYDLKCSRAEIRNSKKCIQANLMMQELISIKKCDIIKVFAKLKPNNFQIFVNGDCINIDLSPPLKQFIDSLGKPSKYQSLKADACKEDAAHQTSEEKTSSEDDQKPSKKGMWSIFGKMMGNN